MLTVKKAAKPSGRMKALRDRAESLFPHGIEYDWSIEQVGKDEFILRQVGALLQSGGEDVWDYDFPLHFKIMEVRVYHTDGTGAISTENMTFKWYLSDGDYWLIMWNETNVGYSIMLRSYQDEQGGGRNFNPCKIRFVTETTLNHIIQVNMRIKVLID